MNWMLSRCLKILGLAVCSVLPMAQGGHAQTHLTFCYDPYPPYTFGTEGAPTGGLKVELLNQVVDRLDEITAEVVLLPWARCQDMARAGSVDGILPLFESEARAAYLAFTDATFVQSSALWYRTDGPVAARVDATDYADVAALRLGLLNGAVIDPEMEDTFARHQPIRRANSVQALFDMVRYGRIDLAAIDRKVGEFYVEQAGLTDTIGALPIAIVPRTAHFGLSRASGADRHLDAFNTVLAIMRAEGVFEEILESGW